MAWLNEYGHLGATRVILVISSHDLEDHPTFASLNPIPHPSQDPPSATYELFSRYLNVNSVLNKLRSQGLLRETPPIQPADPQPGDNPSPGRFAPLQKISNRREVGLIELRKLFIALQSKGVKVGVVQFWERDETVSGNPRAEHALLLDLFREIRIPVVQSGDYFRRCSANPSVELYVDAIHPYTEAGQSCLADAIEAALKELEPMH